MTVRVVVDNSNVTKIPVYNPHLIPNIAREFADSVEAGKFGDVDRAVLLLETDVGVLKFCWGDDLSHFEVLGILQVALTAASITAIDDLAGDDD